MKLFAMLMLRCALLMHLSSLLRNGTVATRGSLETFTPKVAAWKESSGKLGKWKESCKVMGISNRHKTITLDELVSRIPETKKLLEVLLSEVNKFPLKDEMEEPEVNEFPIEGMEELLKRRLQKPLEIAIANCDKVLDKVKHSGQYLESLLSKIRSIAKEFEKEFNTFIIEVELELIKKVKWTSDERLSLLLKMKTESLLNLSQQELSYYDPNSFENAALWAKSTKTLSNKEEFDYQLETIIFDAKLRSLKNELFAKIAVFEEQQPHIDGDGFIEFSRNFKLEWNQIEQKSGQLKSVDQKVALATYKKEEYSKKLDDLEESAMQKTAPLKVLIIQKLDELVTKCHGLNAMKEIISDVGMFDGAAYKLLVSFEQEFDNTFYDQLEDVEKDIKMLSSNTFCDYLKEDVEKDMIMVSTAYQVKDQITPTKKWWWM
ncbi:hypothetical protein GPALN_006061 [Globodera pallida]|nr:hypothetical protein GPALN_006061 [Globodera pallida]